MFFFKIRLLHLVRRCNLKKILRQKLCIVYGLFKIEEGKSKRHLFGM